jgi:glycosyltransferase involved in cell wall biosynthesis
MTEIRPGITLLIPTFNRAPVLRETLDAITRVERSRIDCDIVVIDNNCSDDTATIVRTFRDRLPLKIVHEARPGKNCALNKALRECALREIVVFADDDVTPHPTWFDAIIASTLKWPDVAVFGGKVEITWPNNQQPVWAEAEWIRIFGFSLHHYATTETFYRFPACPFGPNYWVRRSVFQKVPRFDDSIGPRPNDRIMGSETSFLMEIHRAGLQILYCPAAIVQHRVLDKECQILALRRRGFTFGRGQVRLHGRHRHGLYARSKMLWALALIADHALAALRFLVGVLHPNPKRNCEITVRCMIRFGQIHETRRLAKKNVRSEY